MREWPKPAILSSMNDQPTRWILTGGAGFLGTNFLQTSTGEGGEIVVISRHPPRWPVVRPWIRYVEQDIREVDAFRDEITPGSVVVHMASGSYPGKAEKMIESDIQDNVLGTIRLAHACADRQAKSFIFISSGGAVYGNQAMSPIPEIANPIPISAYGAMKLTIEHYLYVMHLLKKLPMASLRIGNCFGRWHTGNGQGAVNVFLRKILQDETIDIWGDGEQVRDYVFADDVCTAIRSVVSGLSDGYETVNVGTGKGTTLKELIAALERVTGRTARVAYSPGRSVDVHANILSTSHMFERFGWRSTHSLEESLKNVLEWVNLSV